MLNFHENTKIISFSGIDGCGKTTIINNLQRLLLKNQKDSSYVWLRYNHYLTKFLLAYCRLVGLTKYEYPNGIRVGYHNFKHFKIISLLFIFFTYIDTLFASIFKIYIPAYFSDKIIICDRWVPDILIDLEIDTGIKISTFCITRKLFENLVPKNTFSFILRRNFKCVVDQRPEHLFDINFPLRFTLFNSRFNNKNFITIDNNGSIDASIKQIIMAISKPDCNYSA